VVTATLNELTGPERGTVELPQRLMWNPNRRFDLDNPDELLWMYENVLREAIRTDELRQWINAGTLLRTWRHRGEPAVIGGQPARHAIPGESAAAQCQAR
jgi:hypothetical protein